MREGYEGSVEKAIQKGLPREDLPAWQFWGASRR